ncbi:4-hydroxy-tetrahydrodipicolinate synthase [Parasphingorhabdus cellanae]|uniref:4-hydroxy-tetrahydrodipicolinate synthase n=1 Tax=Parasphingorhabdus cellanae TaxID=2806553 RepID=A0ABX7T527_9SPHN|nr:4-hydroxy-tetrahydrodipicolinate synthase [Parasphingorhabdus cellanae]QTD55910.1 4-hydroxy-tetrahydrodipicolinate synthase [Parasphingorhabdus cellanae]
MFSGSIPALVTPFRDGSFAESEFRALVDWQIEQGSSGLVPCGTTGESSTLSNAEHHRVIEVCVEQAAGRVPIIAGCGSNDTTNALLHLNFSKKCGATAGLVVAPYYNRPNQEGIFAHFETLTKKNDLPLVLYNVPARTVTDILPETVAALSKLASVIAIKDASGEIDRVTDHRLACDDNFCLLSGVDELSLAFNASGGAGCISVTANVAPKLCAEFQAACAAGDYEKARELNDKLYPLHKAMFSDASPGPVKYALSRVVEGFPTDLRLPMTPPSDEARKAVDVALEGAGLI